MIKVPLIVAFLSLYGVALCSFAAHADFDIDKACVKGASLDLGSRRFGEDKEKMDSDALGTLCTGNNASAAINCVTKVYAHFSNMRPEGLADVCSEGVTGDYAINCLQNAETTLNRGWIASVDACNELSHKFASCSLPAPENFNCAPLAAGKTTSKGSNPR